jgi:RNA polymerase sigma-70 factor (ECF subfamily)
MGQPGNDDKEDQDHVLVERSQKGDKNAFRLLFVRYQRRAYALAFGVVHNQQDALDVVQEAFLKAHRHLSTFQGSASFYTWLYRIVMNVAIDHVRKQSRSPTVDYDDTLAADEGEGELMPSALGRDPARELSRKELREQIGAALEKLSPNHRAVLVMREIDGLSYEEMAETMGCSKGTIMSRLFHARRYMQKFLLDAYGERKDPKK